LVISHVKGKGNERTCAQNPQGVTKVIDEGGHPLISFVQGFESVDETIV